MYIVTNRKVDPKASGLDKLGSTFSEAGPNELRLVEATKTGKKWKLKVLPNAMTDAMKKDVRLKNAKETFTSRFVARKVLERARKNKRAIVIFVHGYNNDIEDVLERAHKLAQTYKVEVVPFSWPANGGGFLNVSGTASYKSDKREALASAGALNQVLAKFQEILNEINGKQLEKVKLEAEELFEDKRGSERKDMYIFDEMEKFCPTKINLMLHSMGNYLFKHLLKSSVYDASRLLFDNVLLVAADTNNKDHAQWVDRIQCRNRVYITINEKDKALKASRIKSGEEQQARLGHYPHNLYSHQAVYVNFTGADKVGKSHAYFEEDAIENDRVRDFFAAALNGETAEIGLPYDEATHMHRIPE